MKKLLLSLLVLGTSLAHAQELPDVSERCAPTITERSHLVSGDPSGMWFHIDVARCMLERLRALPLYARRVQLLEERIALSDHRTELLREAIDVGKEIEEHYQEALDAALRRLERAQSWSRSPGLWLAVGVALAGALVALAAYALDTAR